MYRYHREGVQNGLLNFWGDYYHCKCICSAEGDIKLFEHDDTDMNYFILSRIFSVCFYNITDYDLNVNHHLQLSSRNILFADVITKFTNKIIFVSVCYNRDLKDLLDEW